MSTSSLEAAVSALRDGRWDEYVALIRDLQASDEDGTWVALAAVHPVSVNLVSILATLSSDQARLACHCLLPAIGKLPALTLDEAQSILKFAELLELSYRHAPALALEPHVRRQSGFGVALGNRLQTDVDSSEAAIRTWAGAFTTASPKDAATYLAALVTASPVELQPLVTMALFLPQTPEVASTLVAHEKSLADLIFSKATDGDRDAWSALTNIAVFSPTAMGYVFKAIELEDSVAAAAVANSLFRLSTPTYGVTAESLQNIVKQLLRIGVNKDEVRARIDHAISNLMLRAALRPHAVACLLDLCTIDDNVVNMFEQTFGNLGRHKEDFAAVLSDWLLRADASTASVGGLLSMCTAQRAPIGLDAKIFATQSSERRVKAMRKLLALTHDGPALCRFVAVIAEMIALGDERFSLAGQVLDATYTEYPGAAEEFLKQKTKATPKSAPIAHVYRAVYANVLRWQRVLARLPHRKELRPTDAEVQALRAMKRRFNREVMRETEERSIFHSIVTTVHVAQGRKFASRTPFGPPQVIRMAQASHSIELPSSERADPMRGQLERLKLLEGMR